MPKHQALVFGASGLAGWAMLRECVLYNDARAFMKVIGLSCQPLTSSDLLLAEYSERVHLQGGIDLRGDAAAVESSIRSIPGIESTTHVFYAAYGGHAEAYGSPDPFGTLARVNTAMLSVALNAVLQVCPLLKVWVLQAGAKAYGFELLSILGEKHDSGPPTLEGLRYRTPLRESDLPVERPFGSMIFYNAQHELLEARSRGQKWQFCELMPGVIAGHTPRVQAQNFAQLLALWLSLFAFVNGQGSPIDFPGPESAYEARWSDTAQDTLGRFAVLVALDPRGVSGERYNIADEDEPSSWESVWPDLCAFFGLCGRPPARDKQALTGADWVLANRTCWPVFEQNYRLRKGVIEASSWSFLDVILCAATFDRQFDMRKARGVGYGASSKILDAYFTAFRRMRKAGVIP